MRSRIMRAVFGLLTLAGFTYLVHGANQADILSGLLLNGDAWGDESNSIAFMILGGIVAIVGVLGGVLWRVEDRLENFRREIRNDDRSDRE